MRKSTGFLLSSVCALALTSATWANSLQDIITKGSTSRSVTVDIIDSTDGTPETGVVFNTSGIDLWYRREGAARTAITEATLAALTTAWSSGGFLHVSDGTYRLDLPDAAFATGANYVDFGGTVTGMIVIGGRVKLVDVNLEVAAIPANVTQFGGTNGTFASGRPEVNLTHIAGSAVSTSSAQLGVNVVNAGATAWGSGAITAGSIASDAITAAKIANDAIGATEIADGAIDAAAVAADTITAAKVAADVSTEFSAATFTVNATQLSGDSTAADNAESFFDGTGYAGTNNVIPTVTTVTNLTNAPTAGDFTATMKTSIGTAVAASAVASVTGNVGGNVTGSVGSVATGGITAASIATDAIGAAELASDAGTELGTAAWATTTRLLTAGTNIVLDKGTGITGFNDPTAAANADAVWDELQAGHTTPDTFGAFLDSSVSGVSTGGVSAGDIANAVWDLDATGHQTQGTFGQVLGDSAADTDSVWSLANTNLNATVSSRATQTSVDTVDDFVDTEIATITSRLGTPSDLGGGASIAANLADIEAQTDDIGVAGAGLTAADDAVMTRLGTPAGASVSADVAAIKAQTNNISTAGAIADAVWDEAQSGHTTPNTFGDFLDSEVSGAGGSGGATASEIADEVQTRTIAAVTTVNGLAANTITAAATAADFKTEVTSGLATSSDVTTSTSSTAAAIAALNDLAATDIRDVVVETQGGTISLGCAIAAVLAYAAGDVTTTATESTYEDPSGSQTRIEGSAPTPGNRTAAVTCPSY